MLATIMAMAVAAPAFPSTTPKALIEGMFKRYYVAKTIQGSIVSVQTALGARVNLRTDLAIKSPDHFRIAQARDGSRAARWLAASDGKIFSYDRPDGVKGKPRFAELVTQNGKKLTNRDMYQVVGTTLGDKHAAIDIAFGRTDDLRGLTNRWGKEWKYVGEATVGGRKGYRISSSMRPFIEAQYWDAVEMVIDADFNLLGYKTSQRILVDKGTEPVIVVTDSVINFTVDGDISDQIFAAVG